jgi:chitin disaccharide deacetylase
MRMVLNADDFGSCDDTVQATIRCFEAGALTSATIMPKMPATAGAVAFAKAHSEFSFGVHLTFCSDGVEVCVSDPRNLPALARPDGHFLASNRVRLKALARGIPLSEIQQEISRQLARMADLGVTVSHVDSHGHLHKFPAFAEGLKQTLPRFGIRRVRNVQNVYLRAAFLSPTYWLGHVWRRKLEAAFTTTQHFYMPASTADLQWTGEILQRFRGPDFARQTLEIGVHPGWAEGWRKQEMEAIVLFAEEARAQGHELITWRDV